jgi:hypothetical protein
MYPFVLGVHSLLRWLVLALGAAVVARAVVGLSGRRWTLADDRLDVWFVASLDVQLVIGLVLYGWLSPITTQAFGDMRAAMADSALRFWTVEHVVSMLVAVALAHVGRSRVRRAPTDHARHVRALVFAALALLAVLAGVPWPFLDNGRPLLRPLF